MKLMTILGTRPEIIRLSRIIPKLDEVCQHILVNTRQNFAQNMNDIFFSGLGIRTPDYSYQTYTIGGILTHTEQAIYHESLLKGGKPDKVLILGDTNSGLSALIAKRMGIKVYHMEAGNRCFDDVVPEEVNRRVIDHCSDVLMPYTERSRHNLLREGIPANSIYVIGNPIKEVIDYYKEAIAGSTILDELGVRTNKYILATVHRAETVEDRDRLTNLVNALSLLAEEYGLPVISGTHPRTRQRLKEWDIGSDKVIFHEPFGFFDFVTLELNARCVITDSGTVPEECCVFNIPSVTVRYVTERPETVETGGNILVGTNYEDIAGAVNLVLNSKVKWQPPAEYLVPGVSDRVVKIIMGV